MQTVLELATEIKQETDTEKIRVYPYEMARLGYHGERSAYVCLTCGNF